jgi:hypothetical protein
MRKLKFDLQVDPTALLAANPEAFYSQAYLSEDTADNYRSLPGVKYKTKLATVTFGDILQPSNCSFHAPSDDLNAKEIDVCALSAMAQICQFDLEQSFLSLQMTKGSNGDFSVASFMSFYWGEMANKINGDIELIRWQGDTLSTNPTLALCDGYQKKLKAGLTDPTDTVINGGTGPIANFTTLESKLAAAFALLPASIATRTGDLRLYMPTQLVNIYRLGVASGNTNAYITQDLSLTFLGVKIVVCPGMSNNTFVWTLKDNLIYAFDAEGDSSDLRAVNLADTVAEPYIRTRANMKVGFEYVNGSDIVFYI